VEKERAALRPLLLEALSRACHATAALARMLEPAGPDQAVRMDAAMKAWATSVSTADIDPEALCADLAIARERND
jgi:hypothetical protein